ncbi:putative toxin-antitoxin system toxin component, PIN family [Candidatus Woesearchaeota archaeon]|nr:putative toxin-antitoxin system toxin component, PIN family [Candidatus Woesearchaeota archaeon]
MIDTNVFISGIFWKGESNRVLVSWKKGEFVLISSLSMISEIARVLRDFKIKLPEKLINEWTSLIIRNSLMVEPAEKVCLVKDDPKDNMFLEAAIAGKADYIVSQDKHLLKLKKIRGIKIIKPNEFNEIRL